VDIVGGPIDVINEEGQIVMTVSFNINHHEEVKFVMLFQNPLPLPTVFIRRERIADLLDFGNSGLEDFNFFLDLLFKNTT
jgi:hypothetical protein